MAALHIPGRRTRQPAGRVALNYSHWAADGVVHATSLRGMPADAAADTWELVGSADQLRDGATESGFGLENLVSTDYWQAPSTDENSVGNIIVLAEAVIGSASNSAIASKQVLYGNGWRLCGSFAELTGTNNPAFVFYNGGWRLVTFPTDLRATGSHVFAGSFDGSELLIAVDGVVASANYTGSMTATTATVKIGVETGDAVKTGGPVSMFALIDRSKISAGRDELRELTLNPWEIFRADPVRFYSLPSGAITLTSLTMSNPTSSGARATLGITR